MKVKKIIVDELPICMTNEIKNTDAFDVVYDRILESTCTKNQKELSEVLGVPQSVISDAKRRHVISSKILILLFDKFHISPNYIRYGLADEKDKLQVYEALVHFCTGCDSGRGIWKRIDENREILDFLQKNTSALEDFPYLEVWISKQDEFLVSLCNVMKLPSRVNTILPRAWAGESKQSYVNYNEANQLSFMRSS